MVDPREGRGSKSLHFSQSVATARDREDRRGPPRIAEDRYEPCRREAAGPRPRRGAPSWTAQGRRCADSSAKVARILSHGALSQGRSGHAIDLSREPVGPGGGTLG